MREESFIEEKSRKCKRFNFYLHISGEILQNLDWLQLKFDFVSGTATISTEFSSCLKFAPISNETAA
jgi:hypothetical protein